MPEMLVQSARKKLIRCRSLVEVEPTHGGHGKQQLVSEMRHSAGEGECQCQGIKTTKGYGKCTLKRLHRCMKHMRTW